MSKKKRDNDIWVSFIGGSRDEVCGSAVLVSYPTPNEEKPRGCILLDCGMIQGAMSPEIEYSVNKKMLENIPLEELSAVFLSHGHIDHSGGLPICGKDKFQGQIIMDYQTSVITKDLLKDSVYLHDCLIKYLRSKGKRSKHLYTDVEMYVAFDKFKAVEKHKIYELNEYVSYEFYESGHCLGSQIKLYFKLPNKSIKTIVYTGDLSSKYNAKYKPYNEELEMIPKANTYIFEGTYGASDGREFNKKQVEKEIKELKVKIANSLKKGHRVFIPAFSFARTEEILTLLWSLFKDEEWFKKMNIPIWVDGKLTNKMVQRYSEVLEGEKLELWNTVRSWGAVKYNKDYKGTEALISARKCGIYISSSGFIQAKTRSCDYVKNFLPSEKALIVFIGYFGNEHSVGYQIVNTPKGKPVKIDGSTLIKSCDVIQFLGFSSHIQKQELLSYFKAINAERILIHHAGEKAKEELVRDGKVALMDCDKTTKISATDKYHTTFVV